MELNVLLYEFSLFCEKYKLENVNFTFMMENEMFLINGCEDLALHSGDKVIANSLACKHIVNQMYGCYNATEDEESDYPDDMF